MTRPQTGRQQQQQWLKWYFRLIKLTFIIDASLNSTPDLVLLRGKVEFNSFGSGLMKSFNGTYRFHFPAEPTTIDASFSEVVFTLSMGRNSCLLIKRCANKITLAFQLKEMCESTYFFIRNHVGEKHKQTKMYEKEARHSVFFAFHIMWRNARWSAA